MSASGRRDGLYTRMGKNTDNSSYPCFFSSVCTKGSSRLACNHTGRIALGRWILLVCLLLATLLAVAPSASAQAPVTGAALVRGSLTRQFDRHFLTVSAWDPDRPLTILLEYSPQGRWELDDRSGFFVFDQRGLDRLRSGGLPGAVSVAAGDRLPGESRRLQATIGAPVSGPFTVMVYNDSPLAMGYTLRATNGGFSDGGGQVYDGGAPAPASGGETDVFPLVVVPGPTPVPTPVPTQVPPLRASAVRGWLDARYAQDFFTLEVINTSQPLRIEMVYDPPDQIRLLDSFNFWLFDEEQFRTQEISGARPEFEPNRAAGALTYRDDTPVWMTTVTQPLDRYMLVVNQHVHALAVGYRLTVENGVLVDEGKQAQAVFTRPVPAPGQDYFFWVVRPGETLGSISLAAYGDRGYYRAICNANSLPNCNRLVTGQRLLLPPISALPAPQPLAQPGPVATRAPSTGGPVADNLLDVAAGVSSLQTARDLLRQTPLGVTLTGPGPYTLFAFTNSAFDALPIEAQDELLLDETLGQALFLGLVANGRLSPDWVTRTKHIAALDGSLLRLQPDGVGGFSVNGVPVVGEAIPAANGVIFILDGLPD